MNDIREKLIEHDLACLSRYQGINDSIYYEHLARNINDLYALKQPEYVKHRKPLGIKVLAIFDDHGFVNRTGELEPALQEKPDMVIFGGDHSVQTIELVAEVTPGITKYALRGNHDYEDIEDVFLRVGAKNIHGRIVEAPEGLFIAGLQGSHVYREDRKGRPLYTHYESMCIAKLMIEELKDRRIGMDILFSHDRAFTRTKDPSIVFNDGTSHVGLMGITWLTNYHAKPDFSDLAQYFIHGHLHQNQKEVKPNGQIEEIVYGVRLLNL